ncbi:transcriptional regulator [Klebsiella pneumoniae]|uniref:helix-turn-helix transcriptional regulator n=1 Tax=Klebsiella pneumoniae TaxID=573 RepID=UPI001FB8DA58|nr:hypothetical protein [Klebsiella pneumoniae]
MAMHNPPHPDEALREDVLSVINMLVAGLVRHIGFSRGQFSTVLNGQAAVAHGIISPNNLPMTCGRQNIASIHRSHVCSSPDSWRPSPQFPALVAGHFSSESGIFWLPHFFPRDPASPPSHRICARAF